MSVAIECAIRSPDRVTGVVLEGYPAFTPEEWKSWGRAIDLRRECGSFDRSRRVDPTGGSIRIEIAFVLEC